MNRQYILRFSLCFFILIFGICPAFSNEKINQADYPENIDFWSDYPNDVLAEIITQRMTNEELLAQILMFGWSGAEPTPLLNAWVEDRALGSVKVFAEVWQFLEAISARREVWQVKVSVFYVWIRWLLLCPV